MTIVEKYQIVGENKTAAAFRDVLRGSEATAAKMQKVFRNAIGGVSALALGRSVFNWSKQAIDHADAMGTLAQSFSTTTEELSRLDYALKQNNTNMDEVTSGLTAFQKNLVLAGEDSGRARKAIAELNIDAERLTRLPLNRQLEEVAEAFRSVTNPAERVRVAAQLFGDEVGRKMIPILAAGKEGIRAFGEESDRLGNTLTTEVVAKLQETDTEFKKIEASAMVLKRELAVGLGPAFVTIGNWATQAAGGVKNFGEALARAIHGPDEPIEILNEKLGELADRRRELLTTIRRLEAAPELVLPGKLDEWKRKLAGVEAEMARTNAAMQQFGRDAAAAGGGLKPVEASAQRVIDKYVVLQGLVRSLRNEFPHTIAAGDAMLQRSIGPSDDENAAHLASTFRGINEELFPIRERTLQIGEALQFTNEAAKSFMTTIRDESARQTFVAIRDVIGSMGTGMDNFRDSAINAFRDILANAATRELFSLLGSIGKNGTAGGFLGAVGSFFGSIAGVESRDSGGPGYPGRAYKIGVPEYFVPSVPGNFIPKHKTSGAGGGGQVVNFAPVYNIDARGATMELVKVLPGILKQHGEETEARIVKRIRGNYYTF